MAQTVRVRLVDDLDGGEAHETVTFSFEGKPREIELSHENAVKFRRFMQPYMDASRPARADNIAAKGAPAAPAKSAPVPQTLTQAQQREEAASIREWCEKHHLPVNKLGRIPTNTRRAWEQHTQRNDRSLLDALLEKAGVDTNMPPAITNKVVSIDQSKHTVEAQLERRARAVGKLSPPQEKLLREACEGDSTRTPEDAAERSSYKALVRRGFMDEESEDTFQVTDVGRTWVRLHQTALSA
ncbi:Lsr2 family protein [Streptomyces sp. NPDC058257]|uniref:histone-like nucleoid-structuring protein Lsr2 n=1 Tax=Streptomyces sp. NPDC058257 TaxID=3346409 RepID=UPI0036E00E31